MKRSGYCGDFRRAHVGQRLTACGWVSTCRDMGGVVFVDLRDREGTLQCVCSLDTLGEASFTIASHLHNEDVVSITGILRERSADTYNPAIATGEVELMADAIELLSASAPLPYAMDDGVRVREELRLKYRYLDLRTQRLSSNMRMRARLCSAARRYLEELGCIEVETPMLTRSTPEGARDYLVPSRVHKGSFYALPQSPQLFKQLLMIGGMDRYYQIARCFRDEDLRADRQPEFTQIDVEMSFVEQEDVISAIEGLCKAIMRELKGIELTAPFQRMTWQTAMDVYGSDKPDLRFGLPIVDLTDLLRDTTFSVFQSVLSRGGVIRAISIPGGGHFSRSAIEDLTAKALHYGARGMAWIAVRPDGELYSILTKYLTDTEIRSILAACDTHPGDFVIFCADTLATVRRTLGGLRLDIADILGLRTREAYAFTFVTDFPEFEYSAEEDRWTAMHHPFTMPYEEDLPYLLSDPGRVRAQAYDIVLNGVELGGGSIRIHRQDVQARMFEALGLDRQTIRERFGFFVDALRYGTPPHGGFALGLDRFVMLLTGADSLRDVIAFPKIKDASCPLTAAPDAVPDDQLEVLGLAFKQDFNTPLQDTLPQKRKTEVNVNIDHIAKLARLRVDPVRRDALTRELTDMVAFAEQLSAVDTTDITPTAHAASMVNRFREDEAAPSMSREELLANAPAAESGGFVVPRVVE
ncbi:MAG: aspartate--tRNA ligase [Ruminococcaceae bacterium]|nr:aspartate--tRNA ligase [Oscillospiraceae bacterium]